MSNYDSSKPWLARVLIPFWILQLIISGILLILCIYVMAVIGEVTQETGVHLISASAIILLVFSAISFLFDIAEMVAFSCHNLSPLAFLISNCIKTATWIIFLIMSIYVVAVQHYIGDLIMALIFCLIFGATLIYASVVYHRQRKSTKYSPMHARNLSTTDAHNDPGYWAAETSYDAHMDMNISSVPDPRELHFYGSDVHSAGVLNPRGSMLKDQETTPHITSEELDVEGQAALHPNYRLSVTGSQQYEPVRMQVHEMETEAPAQTGQVREADDVSPLSEAHSGESPHEGEAKITPVSPLARTGSRHQRQGSSERRVSKETASMGGLIKLAAHEEEK